jgi:hypothetical protein
MKVRFHAAAVDAKPAGGCVDSPKDENGQ